MYKVVVGKSVLKFLKNIPVNYRNSISNHISNLSNNPRPFGCIKLSGSENSYRIRVGIYRIIYSIEDDILTVEVVKVDHRSSVYK
jgi:mRNA interferase RelE/StbE